MIETESQRKAALSWIRYWKESVSAGQQSWLGQEQALQTIMTLHSNVQAYEEAVRAATAAPGLVDSRVSPDASEKRLRGASADPLRAEMQVTLVDVVALPVEAAAPAPVLQAIGSQMAIKKGMEP